MMSHTDHSGDNRSNLQRLIDAGNELLERPPCASALCRGGISLSLCSLRLSLGADLIGTASIHSLELGCCTRKPLPGGLSCAAAELGGPVPDGAPATAAGMAGGGPLLDGGLTGPLPKTPAVGRRMDCEALESMVVTEPLLPGSALSQDLTCMQQVCMEQHLQRHAREVQRAVKASHVITTHVGRASDFDLTWAYTMLKFDSARLQGSQLGGAYIRAA